MESFSQEEPREWRWEQTFQVSEGRPFWAVSPGHAKDPVCEQTLPVRIARRPWDYRWGGR